MTEAGSSDATIAPIDDGYCIACGPFSEIGLRMRFEVADDESVHSRITVGASFQGWRNVVHGGVVAMLLDEAMAYAAGARGLLGVTADLKMRFRRPVPVGRELLVRGNVLWQRRNVLSTAATVTDGAGTLLASAAGSFVSRGPMAPGQRLGEPHLGGT
ncbi:MAG: PaaI family thioesterase [Candidatus Eremiobacteraeota bacterium]|nr:PaaI family thioesterase [Candidatus Eremiobacteraeota bacterium]